MTVMLNSELLNGATIWLWAEATASAESTSSAVLERHAYTSGVDAQVEASTDGAADRTAWAPAPAMVAEAAQAGIAVRHARLDGEAQTESVSSSAVERTAWMEESSSLGEGFSESDWERWRLAFGVAESEAAFGIPNELETVSTFRVTKVRDTRGIAHTAIDEGRITELRVRQLHSTSTAVARSSARGLANTRVAFGRPEAEAFAETNPSRTHFIRGVEGAAEANALPVVQPRKVRRGSSALVGESVFHAAPTVIAANGEVTSYGTGTSVAESRVPFVDGIVERWLHPLPSESVALTEVTHCHFIRGVEASVLAEAASSPSTPLTRINPWQFAHGEGLGEAASTSDSDHLVWVGASGSSASEAEAYGTNIRYRWVGVESDTGPAEAVALAANRVFRPAVFDPVLSEALESGTPYRVARPEVESSGAGGVGISVVVYHWAWVTARAEAVAVSARADGLRTVEFVPVRPIESSAEIAPFNYAVNAGEPAPNRRTLVLEPQASAFVVQAEQREYIVA